MESMFTRQLLQIVKRNQVFQFTYVNEVYDKGDIIFQAKCKIDPSDTPDTLAEKVHALEYQHYPKDY